MAPLPPPPPPSLLRAAKAARNEEKYMVTLSYGCYSEPLPVNGMTVGQIRNKYADRFDIDPRTTAIIDGQEVTEDTIVTSGSVLLFCRTMATKEDTMGCYVPPPPPRKRYDRTRASHAGCLGKELPTGWDIHDEQAIAQLEADQKEERTKTDELNFRKNIAEDIRLKTMTEGIFPK